MIQEKTFTETAALALRTHQYSETSCVITWLTSDRGRISTVVKGAFRPKSAFLGQHDLFYTCNLVYYDRDHNGLHVAREFSPIKPRIGIRESWRSSVLASYAASLICDMPQHDPHSSELFDLTEATFDFIEINDAGLALVFWFELQFLRVLGLAPHLANCSGCGRPFQSDGRVSFSPADGGLRCYKCGTSSHHTHSIQPDTLAILRNWQNKLTPRAAHNTKFTPVQSSELSGMLKSFMDFHVAFQHESRDIAVKLLRHINKRNEK